MRTMALSVFLVWAVTACASTGDAHDGVLVFNPDLREALAQYSATMAAPRAPMTMASGPTVSSCDEYLAQGSRAGTASVPANNTASLDYVICDSVAALHDAVPAPSDAAHARGETLADRLDLRSFRSSRYQRTTDEAYTLRAVTEHPLVIDTYSAALDSPGWYFKLEVVAVADIDGSGQADWLVWMVDQSRGGSYLSVVPLVVHDPSIDGLLTATPLAR